MCRLLTEKRSSAKHCVLMVAPQKIKNIITIMIHQFHSWDICIYTQKSWKQVLRDLSTHVHNIIHNSQKWKQSKHPPVGERINEMWCVRTVEYYSALRKKNSDVCYNMDEPWRHCMKRNKSVTKVQTLYDATSMRYPEWLKVEWWLPGAGGGESKELVFNGYEVSLMDDEKVLEMMVVMAAQRECIESHRMYS